ncbi:MAG: hypothetical protein ACP5D1_11135 [Bacteroidales bacterium]
MQKTRSDMQEGYLILQPDGKYELFERHADGTGVTRKGSFRIHAAADPMRIMIGPDDLDAPGAEWVTNFGIFRFHSQEELEIRFSQTGDYPSEFAEKVDTDTMVLVKE